MSTGNPYEPPKEDSKSSKPPKWVARPLTAFEILLVVAIIIVLIGLCIPAINT